MGFITCRNRIYINNSISVGGTNVEGPYTVKGITSLEGRLKHAKDVVHKLYVNMKVKVKSVCRV